MVCRLPMTGRDLLLVCWSDAMRRRGVRRGLGLSRGVFALCMGCALLAGCAPPTGPAATPPPTPGAEVSSPPSDEALDAPTTFSPTPPPSGKVTLPVSGAFQWDASKPISLGEVGQFQLTIRPQVAVTALTVTMETSGAVMLITDSALSAGPIAGGAEHSFAVGARVDTPGRVEIRARVVGSDGDGRVLFETSYPLYLLAVDGRVLAGVEGFTALERAELERRRAAREVDDATYEREKRRIHGGGAQESITVTPAAPEAATN